jgi:hypothetical protein
VNITEASRLAFNTYRDGMTSDKWPTFREFQENPLYREARLRWERAIGLVVGWALKENPPYTLQPAASVTPEDGAMYWVLGWAECFRDGRKVPPHMQDKDDSWRLCYWDEETKCYVAGDEIPYKVTPRLVMRLPGNAKGGKP